MKTTEEIIKGLKHRITRLEQFMSTIVENHEVLDSHLYNDSFACHTELSHLLDWITSRQDDGRFYE